MNGDIIPNGEILYRYIKPGIFPEDQQEIPFTIFEGDRNLSCDWALYQLEPEKSYHIEEGKNKILQILVCDDIKFPCNPTRPRQKQVEWEQNVAHRPISKEEDSRHPEVENFSHSQIEGLKTKHITSAIAKNCKVFKVVPLSASYE